MRNPTLIAAAAIVGLSVTGGGPYIAAQPVDQDAANGAAQPRSRSLDELSSLLGPGETLGLAPIGDPSELRGVTRVYLHVERFDNDATRPQARLVPDTHGLSQQADERRALMAEIGRRCPSLQFVDRLAWAEAAITVCEVHLEGKESPSGPSTSGRVYRVVGSARAPLRMLMRLGPYRGELAGNRNAVADAFSLAYENANSVTARRMLPN
jgi:hypothetical protein